MGGINMNFFLHRVLLLDIQHKFSLMIQEKTQLVRIGSNSTVLLDLDMFVLFCLCLDMGSFLQISCNCDFLFPKKWTLMQK